LLDIEILSKVGEFGDDVIQSAINVVGKPFDLGSDSIDLGNPIDLVVKPLNLLPKPLDFVSNPISLVQLPLELVGNQVDLVKKPFSIFGFK
jgi:hypothetical protein